MFVTNKCNIITTNICEYSEQKGKQNGVCGYF